MAAQRSWTGLAERQVTEAGLVIEEAARADERIYFDDIAAIVYYLKAVSWSIPGYSTQGADVIGLPVEGLEGHQAGDEHGKAH